MISVAIVYCSHYIQPIYIVVNIDICKRSMNGLRINLCSCLCPIYSY